MTKIVNVRTKVKDDGAVLAIIFLEKREDPVFLTGKQIKAACALESNFGVLKGSKLQITFYKKGEKLLNGQEVTDDNKIVKDFEIELSEKLSGISAASAFGVRMTF